MKNLILFRSIMMKKKMFVLMFLVLLAGFLAAEPTDVRVSRWHEIRAEAVEDDEGGLGVAVAPDLTSVGDFANLPTDVFTIPTINSRDRGGEGFQIGSRWMFTIAGGDLANTAVASETTASFDMVGWAAANGMAQTICKGDVIIGTQMVNLYPATETSGVAPTSATSTAWASVINIDDTGAWPDGIAVNSSNTILVANFDILITGIKYLKFYFYDATGSGSEAGLMSVWGRRW